VQARPLAVSGAWELTPVQHRDERGTFLEVFSDSALRAATGRGLKIAQVNTSVSKAGVVRGIHLSDVPPGQAKYVTCARGAVLDVVVDLRVGSPTFATWEGVLLDEVDRRAVLVPEGLGHGFCALTPEATVTYLCSTGYAPQHERSVNPFDAELAIAWPREDLEGNPLELFTSAKDAAAPSLSEAVRSGILPRLADVEAFLAAED
jgi:dTDP-4-dehydrorhamnose 3,5-epimerase